MFKKLGRNLARQWVGVLALVVAMGGTVYATQVYPQYYGAIYATTNNTSQEPIVDALPSGSTQDEIEACGPSATPLSCPGNGNFVVDYLGDISSAGSGSFTGPINGSGGLNITGTSDLAGTVNITGSLIQSGTAVDLVGTDHVDIVGGANSSVAIQGPATFADVFQSPEPASCSGSLGCGYIFPVNAVGSTTISGNCTTGSVCALASYPSCGTIAFGCSWNVTIATSNSCYDSGSGTSPPCGYQAMTYFDGTHYRLGGVLNETGGTLDNGDTVVYSAQGV